ncbi:MAG: hypothetical protein HY735_05105 [Verrucomicrobia bacterium]|nr:hypothetical protein [Verrucomicrobiota bacterium]
MRVFSTLIITGLVIVAGIAALGPGVASWSGEPFDSIKPREGEERFGWSDDWNHVEARFSGKITISEDDRDILEITPNGHFTLSESGFLNPGKRLELISHAGAIDRKFFVRGRGQPYEPEGKAWLAEILPNIVRRSGLGAEARVERVLKAKGVEGVFAEISLMRSGNVRRPYFSALFGQLRPTDRTFAEALTQAGNQISSDYELASLLIKIADKQPFDTAARIGFFSALENVESDYEQRRVLSALLQKNPDPAMLSAMLQSATYLGSDYEAAEFLTSFARLEPKGALRDKYIEAARRISSEYERERALAALGVKEPRQ